MSSDVQSTIAQIPAFMRRWLGLDPEPEIDVGVVEGDDHSWGLLDQSAAPAAERLVNRFADMVGFDPVEVDGDFGAKDAERAIESYLWAIDTYLRDRDEERRIRDAIVSSTNQAGVGRFFAEHGPGIIERLERAAEGIESGSMEPYRRAPLGIGVGKAAVIGAAAVGAALLYSEMR